MKKKRAISLLLVLMMVLSIMPATASAKESKTRDGIYIMLDAGHYAHYNKGSYPDYWESIQMWKLTEYLKAELETYPGFVVGTTRKDQTKDLHVYDRGQKAKNYDLLISMHSNSGGNADYPLAIVSANGSLFQQALPIGRALAETVEDVMDTKSSHKIWTKKQSDGRDWYGVIRGASSVGTPSVIVEHSFHTNYSKAKWLMSESNLKKMAMAEASALAKHYGLTKTGEFTAPVTPVLLKVTGVNTDSVEAEWETADWTTGYEIYRSLTKDGDYEYVDKVEERRNTYKDTNLEFDQEYYYKVRGYRTFNGEKKYGPYSNIVSGRTKLSTPTGVDAYGSDYDKSVVKWNKVEGAEAYEIYRKTEDTSNYLLVTRVDGTKSSYVDTNMDFNKLYYYKVRSVKAGQNGDKFSDYSKANGARPKTSKPVLSFGKSYTKVRVKWQPVNGADGYRIYVSTDDKNYRLVTDVKGDMDNYLVEGLKDGKRHYFKACAYKYDNGKRVNGGYAKKVATTKSL
ncbi:MAG: N-acetylmuramoyl-L-alanine amidase [Anaerovoracaceae bacterium]